MLTEPQWAFDIIWGAIGVDIFLKKFIFITKFVKTRLSKTYET